MDGGDDSDEPSADQKRSGENRLEGGDGVLLGAARPFLVVGNNEGLAGFGDTPHRSFAALHSGAEGIGAEIMAGDDHQLARILLVDRELTAGDAEQGNRPIENRVENFRELELAGKGGKSLQQGCLLFRTAAGLGEEPRILDGDCGLRREHLQQPQIFRSELSVGIGVNAGYHADEALADEQRSGHHRVYAALFVLARLARPRLVVGYDQRLVRLPDEPHRSLSETHAQAGRVGAEVETGHHHHFVGLLVENG